MIKEHLSTIMMVAFLVATALSIYKVYVIFEKQAGEGPSIQEIEDEIIAMFKDIVSKNKSLDKKEIFNNIFGHENFDKERHSNFNENRFNQILQRLHMEHKTETLEQLKEKF
jgi:hypothetical protein